MDVRILDRNVGITSDRQETIARCLQFAFNQFSSHIRSADVSFSDVNLNSLQNNSPLRGGTEH